MEKFSGKKRKMRILKHSRSAEKCPLRIHSVIWRKKRRNLCHCNSRAHFVKMRRLKIKTFSLKGPKKSTDDIFSSLITVFCSHELSLNGVRFSLIPWSVFRCSFRLIHHCMAPYRNCVLEKDIHTSTEHRDISFPDISQQQCFSKLQEPLNYRTMPRRKNDNAWESFDKTT